MWWADVYVCRNCGKIYNVFKKDLPQVCRKCGRNMKTVFDIDHDNVLYVAAKRKLFGWEIPGLGKNEH